MTEDCKSKHLSRWQIWKKNNMTKVLAYNKEWRHKNKDKMARSRANWNVANKKRMAFLQSKWKKLHPATCRASWARRKARLLKAKGFNYTTTKHIASRWEMWGFKCWICGSLADQTDHVKPLSKGGAHFPSNLRPICVHCNSSKRDIWPLKMFGKSKNMTHKGTMP